MKIKNIGKEGLQLPEAEGGSFVTLRPGETIEWEGDKTRLTPWIVTKQLEVEDDAESSETKPTKT